MLSLTLSRSACSPCVLFVATCRGEGGIERYSVRLARNLGERGVQVHYACEPDSFLERQCAANGIPAHPLSARNSGDILAAMALARMIVAVGADIVHVHSRRDFVYSALAVEIARKRKAGGFPKLVLHSHLDRPLGEPGYISGRIFRGTADLVIAVSAAVQRRLMTYHRLPAEFVPIVYNGIDLERFAAPGSVQAQRRRAETRERFSVPGDALVIGMLGRMDAKGQDRLLRIAPDLIKQIPNLFILMIGPGETEGLRKIAGENGITERIRIMGCVEDVPSVIPAFDILVHLPETESFGLALVEAMACGIPAVTSDVGGCPEVVEHGISGFVVSLDDDDALKTSIRQLLAGEEGMSLRRRYGAAGHEIVERRFELDNQITELQACYERLYHPLTALRAA
jgi:glycosyltransferase involved in cell wall biosynthesis